MMPSPPQHPMPRAQWPNPATPGCASIAALAATVLIGCGAPDATTIEPPPDVAIEQITHTIGDNERDGAFSPDGEWIVYGRRMGGPEHIWKMPAAGGDPVQLTTGDAQHIYPAWSPDGNRILFTSNRGGQDNVWTMRPDGSDLRQVTSDSDTVAWRQGHLAAWSPDSRQIVFVGVRGGEIVNGGGNGGQRDLFILPAEGGKATQITDTPEMHEEHPAWSPEGGRILFAQSPTSDRQDDLVIIDLATGREQSLVSHPGNDWAPSWSPDGRWIAFCSNRSGNTVIWIVPSMGGTPLPVTSGRFSVVPRWSPDGRRLVFNATDDFWASVVDADGTNPRRLPIELLRSIDVRWNADQTGVLYLGPEDGIWQYEFETGESRNLGAEPEYRGMGTEANFDASPDGRFIAYAAAGPSQKTQIWLLPTSGASPRQVTASDRNHGAPRWSPDGRMLSFSSDRTTIWTVPANGGVERRVFPDFEQSHWLGTWSPDGTRLAFEVQEAGGHVIYAASIEAGDPVRLVAGHSPEWSPDGKRLLFMPVGFLSSSGLRQMPAVGGPAEILFDDGTTIFAPKFSPDGSQILFTSVPAGDLFVAEIGPLLDAQPDMP